MFEVDLVLGKLFHNVCAAVLKAALLMHVCYQQAVKLL